MPSAGEDDNLTQAAVELFARPLVFVVRARRRD